jgi:hypothetical protein
MIVLLSTGLLPRKLALSMSTGFTFYQHIYRNIPLAVLPTCLENNVIAASKY